MKRPEIIPLVGAITPLTCAGCQNTLSRGRQDRSQYGKLHQFLRTYLHGTVLAPRKYLHQKEAIGMETPEIIPLVGAITPLTCAGRQNTCLEGGRIGPSTESCINCDGPISMVPCLHQGNIYIKRKLRVCRDQKCIPLVGAITPLTCAGRQITLSRCRQDRSQYGKLHKL